MRQRALAVDARVDNVQKSTSTTLPLSDGQRQGAIAGGVEPGGDALEVGAVPQSSSDDRPGAQLPSFPEVFSLVIAASCCLA